MVKVSVIVPVHNAEAHIRECLDSILVQTLSDIEVICVDDESTDTSPRILEEYANADSRVCVLRQSNRGAGAARNAGIEVARGEYFSFLDADDFFEPTMLASAYERCIGDSADVGIYKSRTYHEPTGVSRPADSYLRMDLVPERVPFSYRDIPDAIFRVTVPAPWNKMFRAGFVRDQGLRFQHLSRANDVYFTRTALTRAERITVIDEYLVTYRIGVPTTLQSTLDSAPKEFFESLRAVRAALVEAGRIPELERSFVNDALSVCLYNLRQVRTAAGFSAIYDFLKHEGFQELHITGHGREYFFHEHQYDDCRAVLELTEEEFLFRRLASVRGRVGELRAGLSCVESDLESSEGTLQAVRSSRSYRLGRLLTAAPRALRKMTSATRRGESAHV